MKTKLILRIMGLLILIVSLFVVSSCSKKANGNLTKEQIEQQNKNLEATAIDNKNFTESDEDLTTVDYKEFYEQLAPHGEWVQVNPEDIGLKSKTALSKSSNNNILSLATILGVKDAYAETDENAQMVYVWRPSTDLAVTRVDGVTPVYVPYSKGQWVNTDAGWYFKAPTPYEETVSHYGRWVNSPTAGWLWVPGRVWAPAWVDWKQNDNYVSWAPLPPSVYINDGTMNVPVINDNNYMIVNRNQFLEPNIYQYSNPYYDNGNRVTVSDLVGTVGLVVVNNILMNMGPDVNLIQSIYGRTIDLVTIQHVSNFNDVRYLDREYYVYEPGFKRYKNNGNSRFTINEPRSFRRYDEWKENKSEDKENKKEEKNYRKENNGNDNGNKHNSYDNGNKNNGNDNGNKHNSYDNGNKNKGNDNGNENKGNDNGNKNKSNDNGNKSNGNDNGNKHNGNDNGKGKK